MKLPRRQFLHLAGGAAALSAVSRIARAQAYPTRPMTVVVGTAAGGGADLLARIIAERLGELLGQPFVIENVGNAVAAAKRVASAQPDGYIVDFGFTSTHAFHPSLYRKPFYDAVNDFTPVALVAEQSMFLVRPHDRAGPCVALSAALRSRLFSSSRSFRRFTCSISARRTPGASDSRSLRSHQSAGSRRPCPALGDQNIHLPQLRNDLFGLVSLPCHRSPYCYVRAADKGATRANGSATSR